MKTNTMFRSALAATMLTCASLSFAQTTFNLLGPIGHIDGPGAVTNQNVVAGGTVGLAYTVSNQVTINTLTLTAVSPIDYIQDNGVTITNSMLPGLSASFRYNPLGEFYTVYTIATATPRSLFGTLVGAVAPAGSTWSLEFWNDFNDGAAGISEANATALNFTVAGLPAPAFSGLSAGPNNSVDQPYDPDNVIVNLGAATSSFVFGSTIQVSAILNNLVASASGNDAQLRIVNSAFPNDYAQITAGGGLYAAPFNLSSVSTAVGRLVGRTIPSGSTFTVEFCEDKDDAGTSSPIDNNGVAEQTWSSLNIKFFSQPYTAPAAPSSTDLGTITSGSNLTFDSGAFSASQIKWYRFTLGSTLNSSGNEFLDVFTQAKGVTNNDLQDSEIAIYSSNGILLNNDDDDDTRFMSAISFGTGTTVARPGSTPPTGAVGWSNGKGFNGRDGKVLDPGTYYVAIGSFPCTFGHGFAAAGGVGASPNGLNLRIKSGFQSTFSGNVTLNDFMPDEVGKNVSWSLLDGSSNVVDSGTVTLGAAGAYSIQTVSAVGTYTLVMKGSNWLAQGIENNVINGVTSSFVRNFSLLNGDIDNDNFVGLDDFNVLSNAFNSAPEDATFNAAADLDGDEFVGLDDFNVLSNNFNTSGY